jgi:HEPN domain-containing protein
LALNYQGQTDRIVNRIAAERYLNQGRLLRARAEKDASQGHHEAAIETMEQATQHLIDALRASGVEGFY